MGAIALCKGGTVEMAGCRHCRAIAAKNVPVRVVEVDAELLPSGPWPTEDLGGHGGNWVPSVPDPSRFKYLQGLSLVEKVVGLRAFGGRKYEGFVVRGRQTGRLIGLLECELTRNALYIFDASATTWLQTAQLDKHTLRSVKPPEYIRKVTHRGDWQERVAKLLANL